MTLPTIEESLKICEITKLYFNYILEEYKLKIDEHYIKDENNNIICDIDEYEDYDSGEYEEVLHQIFNWYFSFHGRPKEGYFNNKK